MNIATWAPSITSRNSSNPPNLMPIVISKWFLRLVGDTMPGAIRLVVSLLFFALSWGRVRSRRRSGPSPMTDAENWNRLRSMPREQRLALWEKLKEFDALGPTEKSAIQALNARITQLPAVEQANYWSVLSRYHHWVQGLSEEQRNELNAAPPDRADEAGHQAPRSGADDLRQRAQSRPFFRSSTSRRCRRSRRRIGSRPGSS